MMGFNNIIGHEEIIGHLKNAIESGKISHSYIFTGEPGSGKKLLAGTFASTLQCEAGGTEPCQKCDSCKKAMGKNHPDIIMVSHEKPGTITIDEIRDQVINDIDIRPYYSPYKIYIIADADLMTPQAQNALLKTIEEPPEYAVILLLTNNIGGLLPTIQSRCVRLDLKVVDDGLVKKYLMEHLHVPDYQAEIDASFAQGSIGRAKEAATSQEFAEMTQNALRILKYANTMEVYELSDAIKSLSEDKQNINDYLDIFQFWFRDVLMFKATQEVDNLVFKQEINYIKEQASQRSYENLEKILEAGNFAPNAGGGQRSMMVAIHNKELAAYVGKLNMADFDRSHLAGSFVSKEQPSTIDDPTIKNGFYDAPTVVCVFCQNNFLFKTADAFCMMENMILQATELGIASCIISRGYETFDSEEGRRLMSEWGVPEGYACQGFVILGYIDGKQPKSKPRKPGRIKIVE